MFDADFLLHDFEHRHHLGFRCVHIQRKLNQVRKVLWGKILLLEVVLQDEALFEGPGSHVDAQVHRKKEHILSQISIEVVDDLPEALFEALFVLVVIQNHSGSFLHERFQHQGVVNRKGAFLQNKFNRLVQRILEKKL